MEATYVRAREQDKLERGRDAAEFSAAKKNMAEEAHRALGTMIVQAKGASAAAAASRHVKKKPGEPNRVGRSYSLFHRPTLYCMTSRKLLHYPWVSHRFSHGRLMGSNRVSRPYR